MEPVDQQNFDIFNLEIYNQLFFIQFSFPKLKIFRIFIQSKYAFTIILSCGILTNESNTIKLFSCTHKNKRNIISNLQAHSQNYCLVIYGARQNKSLLEMEVPVL